MVRRLRLIRRRSSFFFSDKLYWPDLTERSNSTNNPSRGILWSFDYIYGLAITVRFLEATKSGNSNFSEDLDLFFKLINHYFHNPFQTWNENPAGNMTHGWNRFKVLGNIFSLVKLIDYQTVCTWVKKKHEITLWSSNPWKSRKRGGKKASILIAATPLWNRSRGLESWLDLNF